MKREEVMISFELMMQRRTQVARVIAGKLRLLGITAKRESNFLSFVVSTTKIEEGFDIEKEISVFKCVYVLTKVDNSFGGISSKYTGPIGEAYTLEIVRHTKEIEPKVSSHLVSAKFDLPVGVYANTRVVNQVLDKVRKAKIPCLSKEAGREVFGHCGWYIAISSNKILIY